MDAKTFKRLTPLAEEIGGVLAEKPATDVAMAIGMNIGLNVESPEDLDETLEIIKLAAAKYRLQVMNEPNLH
jgi:hypothetical protein